MALFSASPSFDASALCTLPSSGQSHLAILENVGFWNLRFSDFGHLTRLGTEMPPCLGVQILSLLFCCPIKTGFFLGSMCPKIA